MNHITQHAVYGVATQIPPTASSSTCCNVRQAYRWCPARVLTFSLQGAVLLEETVRRMTPVSPQVPGHRDQPQHSPLHEALFTVTHACNHTRCHNAAVPEPVPSQQVTVTQASCQNGPSLFLHHHLLL